jgi:hypothetical protein
MKTTRIIFAFVVLAASFLSAFALRSQPVVNYGYLDNGSCVEAPACEGTAKACKQFLDGQNRDIVIWNSATNCGSVIQTMD